MGLDRELSGDIFIPLKWPVQSLATVGNKVLRQLSSGIVGFMKSSNGPHDFGPWSSGGEHISSGIPLLKFTPTATGRL
ncbi:hypothetical protein TNCV_1525611 [Trichonephila clavipes]|nr:hypothetical protein TNCV_1525611 [Trichonephila clavipes]